MTSTTNARELDRLRQARTGAQERFAKQMRLLEQIEATAAEPEAITARWRAQIAALAELSGSSTNAAELSGLAKADIEAAVKSVDGAAVNAALDASIPKTPRRRRRSSGNGSASASPQAVR